MPVIQKTGFISRLSFLANHSVICIKIFFFFFLYSWTQTVCNLFIKAIPLELKKVIVRLSYLEIRKYTTITFSNIGRIGIIGKYKDYIDEFLMLIAPELVEKIKCSGCTFENKMSFTFTSILNDNNIEKTFYNFLKSRGIKVKIESNGVLDDISKED